MISGPRVQLLVHISVVLLIKNFFYYFLTLKEIEEDNYIPDSVLAMNFYVCTTLIFTHRVNHITWTETSLKDLCSVIWQAMSVSQFKQSLGENVTDWLSYRVDGGAWGFSLLERDIAHLMKTLTAAHLSSECCPRENSSDLAHKKWELTPNNWDKISAASVYAASKLSSLPAQQHNHWHLKRSNEK